MDVDHEIMGLAHEYKCDPRDPLFAVLKKVIEIRDRIPQTDSKIYEKLKEIQVESITAFEQSSDQFKKLLVAYQEENDKAHRLALNTGQNLLASIQIKWRERLFSAMIGMLFPSIILLGGTIWFSHYSVEAKLRKAKLEFKLEPTDHGVKVILIGPKIVNSGRTDRKVSVEFRTME